MRQVEQRKMKSGKADCFVMRKLEMSDFLRSLQSAGQNQLHDHRASEKVIVIEANKP